MKKQKGLIAVAVAAALAGPVSAAELPITVSGLVEVEAMTGADYTGAFLTDIYVATVEMTVDAEVNDRVSAHLTYLYEDGAGTGLDEGYVTLQMNSATSFVAGRTFVPFGDFSTNMVSDPLTLEMAEASEDVLMMAVENGNLSGSIYTFNGDVDETAEFNRGDNAALSLGANVAYSTDNFTLGASYISNIAESDGLEGLGGTVDKYVAGMGAHLAVSMNNFSIIAEHVAAMNSFANGDLAGAVTAEETPTATNVEVAYELNGMTLAAAYQSTSEALFAGLPETAASAAVSFEVMEGASLGIEYITKDDYSVADGGTGEIEHAFTAQLAVEF